MRSTEVESLLRAIRRADLIAVHSLDGVRAEFIDLRVAYDIAQGERTLQYYLSDRQQRLIEMALSQMLQRRKR